MAATGYNAFHRHHSGGPGHRRSGEKSHLVAFLSQVILGGELPVAFCSDSADSIYGQSGKMGEFSIPLHHGVAWVVAAAILFFNAELVWLILRSK